MKRAQTTCWCVTSCTAQHFFCEGWREGRGWVVKWMIGVYVNVKAADAENYCDWSQSTQKLKINSRLFLYTPVELLLSISIIVLLIPWWWQVSYPTCYLRYTTLFTIPQALPPPNFYDQIHHQSIWNTVESIAVLDNQRPCDWVMIVS